MKKCPYCAEEIQEEAVLCRYCLKKVKGIKLRRAIKIAIILALVIFIALSWMEIKKFIRSVQLFFSDIGDLREILKAVIENIKAGLGALKEQSDHLDTISRMK